MQICRNWMLTNFPDLQELDEVTDEMAEAAINGVTKGASSLWNMASGYPKLNLKTCQQFVPATYKFLRYASQMFTEEDLDATPVLVGSNSEPIILDRCLSCLPDCLAGIFSHCCFTLPGCKLNCMLWQVTQQHIPKILIHRYPPPILSSINFVIQIYLKRKNHTTCKNKHEFKVLLK